jgi:hypothetical protein
MERRAGCIGSQHQPAAVADEAVVPVAFLADLDQRGDDRFLDVIGDDVGRALRSHVNENTLAHQGNRVK